MRNLVLNINTSGGLYDYLALFDGNRSYSICDLRNRMNDDIFVPVFRLLALGQLAAHEIRADHA